MSCACLAGVILARSGRVCVWNMVRYAGATWGLVCYLGFPSNACLVAWKNGIFEKHVWSDRLKSALRCVSKEGQCLSQSFSSRHREKLSSEEREVCFQWCEPNNKWNPPSHHNTWLLCHRLPSDWDCQCETESFLCLTHLCANTNVYIYIQYTDIAGCVFRKCRKIGWLSNDFLGTDRLSQAIARSVQQALPPGSRHLFCWKDGKEVERLAIWPVQFAAASNFLARSIAQNRNSILAGARTSQKSWSGVWKHSAKAVGLSLLCLCLHVAERGRPLRESGLAIGPSLQSSSPFILMCMAWMGSLDALSLPNFYIDSSGNRQPKKQTFKLKAWARASPFASSSPHFLLDDPWRCKNVVGSWKPA